MREIRVRKDYAGTEQSPYREWVERHYHLESDGDPLEPVEANPDVLPEEAGLWHVSPCEDGRMEMVKAVFKTLSPAQKKILVMIGLEGKTFENVAQTLGVSKGTVQKTMERIRKKMESCLTGGLPEGISRDV